MSDPARTVTALHEAGHAVAAWRCDRALVQVSIEPNADHLGHVLHVPGMVSEASRVPSDLLLPVRGELRDIIETDMLIALAGAFAQELHGSFTTGYRFGRMSSGPSRPRSTSQPPPRALTS